MLASSSNHVHNNLLIRKNQVAVYCKANWDEIRSSLLHVSETYLEFNSNSVRSVEENWNYFHSHCLKIIENHVPAKLLITRSHLLWLTTPLRRLIRKKQQIYNKVKKYHQPEIWSEYKKSNKASSSWLHHHHDKYLCNIVSSSNSNKKPFWLNLNDKTTLLLASTLISTTGSIGSGSSEKAKAFNEYFKSVFTVEDLSYIPNKGTSPYLSIPEIDITLQQVTNLLSSCDLHKLPGPDNLYVTFLNKSLRRLHQC